MKKIPFASLFLCFTLFSCSKSDDPTPDPTNDVYMTTTAGSTWTYEETNNTAPTSTINYTLTSTNKPDTVISTHPYHIFTNSLRGSEYFYINGANYYSFRGLPASAGGSSIESLYLKSDAAVNASWSETLSLTTPLGPVPITLTYTVKEKRITKIVNGITYNNVIHLSGVLSAPAPFNTGLTSDLNGYYAPKYGLIQSEVKIDHTLAGIHVDVTTKLKTTNF
jgi:hypothetical protein